MDLKRLCGNVYSDPIQFDGWTIYTNGQGLFAVPGSVGIEASEGLKKSLPGILVNPDSMAVGSLASLKLFVGAPKWIEYEKCSKYDGKFCEETDYDEARCPDCNGGFIEIVPPRRDVLIDGVPFDGNLVAQYIEPLENDEIKWAVEREMINISVGLVRVRVMGLRLSSVEGLRKWPE